MSENGKNAMLPYLGRLEAVQDIAEEVKFFSVKLLNGGSESFQDYQPGQFAFLSAFGVGEAPFGIASTPERSDLLEFAVQRHGGVTTEMHELGEGDLIGVRGPLGNSFPMDQFKGKNLVVLGGGIGGAPLRPVIQHVIDHRADYDDLTIFWAARRPDLLLFRDEYEAWWTAPNTSLYLTVDEADSNWHDNIGLITDLLKKKTPSNQNAVTITCGPPVMIHFVHKVLAELGFLPEQSYVTLEARMHCGVGKCGRCNLGEKLICVDGPVFSMAEIGQMLESFL